MNTKELITKLNEQLAYAEKMETDVTTISNKVVKEVISKLISHKDLVCEYCLICGKYKNEHLGACKDCRWENE